MVSSKFVSGALAVLVGGLGSKLTFSGLTGLRGGKLGNFGGAGLGFIVVGGIFASAFVP